MLRVWPPAAKRRVSSAIVNVLYTNRRTHEHIRIHKCPTPVATCSPTQRTSTQRPCMSPVLLRAGSCFCLTDASQYPRSYCMHHAASFCRFEQKFQNSPHHGSLTMVSRCPAFTHQPYLRVNSIYMYIYVLMHL